MVNHWMTFYGAMSLTVASLCNAISPVDHVIYTGVGGTGSYLDVVSTGYGSFECQMSEKKYSGPLAPLNEGKSFHFRGPLRLLEFAFYHRLSGGLYQRTAHYNAAEGSHHGLVFMNTRGGQKSGVWDTRFGNSLSYANSENSDAAFGPTCLKEVTLRSDEDFSIFTDQECDASCGYTRPGVPSYKGFSGSDTITLMRFTMPYANPADGVSRNNHDMPAIWALNAKIPRIAQWSYCSCWKHGCGELDLFEIIPRNREQLITHIHSNQGAGNNQGGGGSDGVYYFKRPSNSVMTGAVILSPDGTIEINTILDTNFKFSPLIDINSIKSKGAKNIIYMPRF